MNYGLYKKSQLDFFIQIAVLIASVEPNLVDPLDEIESVFGGRSESKLDVYINRWSSEEYGVHKISSGIAFKEVFNHWVNIQSSNTRHVGCRDSWSCNRNGFFASEKTVQIQNFRYFLELPRDVYDDLLVESLKKYKTELMGFIVENNFDLSDLNEKFMMNKLFFIEGFVHDFADYSIDYWYEKHDFKKDKYLSSMPKNLSIIMVSEWLKVAASNGHIHPFEMMVIEKAWTKLGLTEDDVKELIELAYNLESYNKRTQEILATEQ